MIFKDKNIANLTSWWQVKSIKNTYDFRVLKSKAKWKEKAREEFKEYQKKHASKEGE